ncbi:hypothetical protein ES703_26924 [subsurface metagenome]
MMTNIREYLDCNSSYSAINREERNLAAILYHLLLSNNNLDRFLALIECPFDVVESEMGIYLEYAYPRDLWSQIKDNTTKRGLVLELLQASNMDALQGMSVLEFNRYFGAVPQPSTRYVQSPGLWSVSRFDRTIEDDDEFLRVCMFKWAFNAKPDIVIHTSRDRAVCIEAKLESSEGQYPQSGGEKRIFRSRGLEYVSQTNLQRYLMENLLGIDTWFVFLVQKTGQSSDSHQLLLWKDVFRSLDLSDIPRFMRETISAVTASASGAQS